MGAVDELDALELLAGEAPVPLLLVALRCGADADNEEDDEADEGEEEEGEGEEVPEAGSKEEDGGSVGRAVEGVADEGFGEHNV